MFISTATAKMPARQRVLLTASHLFYRNGIRATGVDRVIAESGVTKATFYRHFPSKNELVCAWLEERHLAWMAWFKDALACHARNAGLAAIIPAMSEWLHDAGFRGCAFLNSVVEMGDVLPEVTSITRRHKDEMTAAIAQLLPPSRHRARLALAAALAVDGAIMHAQYAKEPTAALKTLALTLGALDASGAAG